MIKQYRSFLEVLGIVIVKFVSTYFPYVICVVWPLFVTRVSPSTVRLSSSAIFISFFSTKIFHLNVLGWEFINFKEGNLQENFLLIVTLTTVEILILHIFSLPYQCDWKSKSTLAQMIKRVLPFFQGMANLVFTFICKHYFSQYGC